MTQLNDLEINVDNPANKWPNRIPVLGIPVDPLTMDESVKRTEELIEAGYFAHLIGVNADKVNALGEDYAFDQIISDSELINADGASMVLASKVLGTPLPERVAGIDLMLRLCELAEQRGYPVYLLGAKDASVQGAAAKLQEKHPLLEVAGIRNGYFSDNEWDVVADEVASTSARIVFVGITSPKKEYLIDHFRKLGIPKVFMGVGGSFDVISGNIPRAPMWMQKANLEWLFRMMNEPRRLAKRYLIGNSKFILNVAKAKVSGSQ